MLSWFAGSAPVMDADRRNRLPPRRGESGRRTGIDPRNKSRPGIDVNQPAFRCGTCVDKPGHDEKQVCRRPVSTFLWFTIVV
jgi:hypothetical protein